MGCDIHATIEAKHTHPESWWEVWATGDLGTIRWYVTFGALAGVRGEDCQPVALPRGIPEDSPQRHDDTWLGDHSRSWLTLEETEEAHRRALAAAPGVTMTGLEGVIAILRHLRDRGETARFVFGFDS